MIEQGIKIALKAAGMPAPVCEIVGNLVPRMLKGSINSPQIIEAVMAYCLLQAQEGVEADMSKVEPYDTFKQQGKKVIFWLGIERRQDGQLASFVGVQTPKQYKEGKMELYNNEKLCYTPLHDFVCTQIRKIREYINIEQIKTKYLPMVQDVLATIGGFTENITSEGLESVLKVVLAIFDEPEKFVELILGVISANMHYIEEGISQELYGTMPIKMYLYGTSSPNTEKTKGIRIHLEIGARGTAGTTIWDTQNALMDDKLKTRSYIPHEEVLARMLITGTDATYFDRNFAALVDTLPATTALPAPTPPAPPQGTDQDKKKSPENKPTVDIFTYLQQLQN